MFKCEVCDLEVAQLLQIQIVSADELDGKSTRKFCMLCIPRIMSAMEEAYLDFVTKALLK